MTREEIKNEFEDIRRDGVVPMLEALCAIGNGHAIPVTVKAKLQVLSERLHSARVSNAENNEETPPARPTYLDPAGAS